MSFIDYTLASQGEREGRGQVVVTGIWLGEGERNGGGIEAPENPGTENAHAI